MSYNYDRQVAATSDEVEVCRVTIKPRPGKNPPLVIRVKQPHGEDIEDTPEQALGKIKNILHWMYEDTKLKLVKEQDKHKTATSQEAQRAFVHEIFPGLGDSVMHGLNLEMKVVFDKLADLGEGTSKDGLFKAMLLRYKPLSMTDAQFAKEVEQAARAWYRRVAQAINTK